MLLGACGEAPRPEVCCPGALAGDGEGSLNGSPCGDPEVIGQSSGQLSLGGERL